MGGWLLFGIAWGYSRFLEMQWEAFVAIQVRYILMGFLLSLLLGFLYDRLGVGPASFGRSLAIIVVASYALFPVRDALLFARRGVTPGSQGHGMYAAENPPYGALLTYYVGQPVADTIAVQIRDARGSVIAEVQGTATRGVHRIVWNLRPQPARAQGGGAGQRPQGQQPEVPPGTYTAQRVRRVGDAVSPLGEARTFNVRVLFE